MIEKSEWCKMVTKRITVVNENMTSEEKKIAGDMIRDGGLVAFPTETVYGLGADALNKEASAKIYKAKGRPSDNPLIVHIASMDALPYIVKEIPPVAYRLCEAFWPGPLTMIFHKSEVVPLETTGGLETIAVRMPDHKVALQFIESAGGYIAAPSANTSGKPSPTTAAHVKDDMNGKIDMIIDDGPVGIGLESTIIDLTTEIPTILRPGFITRKMIEKIVGDIQVDPAVNGVMADGTLPKAPGMKYKHYAPKGELFIVVGEAGEVIEEINQLVKDKDEQHEITGVIATDETRGLYNCKIVKSIGTRRDENTIARHLYGILRELDDLGVTYIYSEEFNTPGMGQAIMNRLLKAAGHKIIYVNHKKD